MVSRTSENEYPVIGVMENTDQYDMYICRDVSEGGLCRIMSVKDSSKFAELVSFLTDTVNRSAFTDYREHFIDGEKLCIVMKYTQGVTLTTKLATESMPFKERLELGRKILEKAVLQDIPDYFLAKCFTPDQMIIKPDLSVSFNYPIEDILGSREQKGRANIEAVLRLLFANELERKVPDQLMEFFDKLPGLSEQRLLDIYSEYYAMCALLEGYDENAEQPKTFWYKLWEKIKKLLKFLKKILILLLILASIAFLIYTIVDPGKNKKSSEHFEYIGTVKIQSTDAAHHPTDPSYHATEAASIATDAVQTATETVPTTTDATQIATESQ